MVELLKPPFWYLFKYVNYVEGRLVCRTWVEGGSMKVGELSKILKKEWNRKEGKGNWIKEEGKLESGQDGKLREGKLRARSGCFKRVGARTSLQTIAWVVIKCSKEPEILDLSIIWEMWVKKCKKSGPHIGCKLFLTLAVNFISRGLVLTKKWKQ